ENEVDVAERRDWPLPRLLAELADGYLAAGPAIAESGGRLDGIAIGEGIHGGDVRDALGEPGAYPSDGFDDAVALLADRALRNGLPLVEVSLPGELFSLGVAQPGRAPATLETDRPTLMRLFAGRPADPAAYRLTGATAAEFEIF